MVIVTTVVTGLDFDKLQEDSATKAKLVGTVKSQVAVANGVDESQVEILLSKGSVRIEAHITADEHRELTTSVPSAADLTAIIVAIDSIAAVQEVGKRIEAGEPDTFRVAAGELTPQPVQPRMSVLLTPTTISTSTSREPPDTSKAPSVSKVAKHLLQLALTIGCTSF
jgi:hypothetical protein